MVIDANIEEEILCNLYCDYFDARGNRNLQELRQGMGWDERAAARTIDEMIEAGLIVPWTAGGNYRITAAGIVRAETGGAAPEDLARANHAVRLRTLELLAERREQSSDPRAVREAGEACW